MMRIAVVSTFYPNTAFPFRTLFVENLVTAMARHAALQVIAPVPYAPPLVGPERWRVLRKIPASEQRQGIDVRHPRLLAIPWLTWLNGLWYFFAVYPALRALRRAGAVNIIHAHCGYPDAVGVALAATALRLPFVVTVHGSDINVYANRPSLRMQMRWAMQQAEAVIAVSADLRRKVCALIPNRESRISHLACAGIDPAVFRPRDRAAARRALGISPAARIVLFVGQLVPVKGIDVLASAWRQLIATGRKVDNDQLVLIGEGPLRVMVEQLFQTSALSEGVRLLGAMPSEAVATWLSAANILVLASRNEGTPNVVVEALASGIPVVATRVGGVPELIVENVNGLLTPPEEPGLLADALSAALKRSWDPLRIAATATGRTWDRLAQQNVAVLERALDHGEGSVHDPAQ
jgi:teichuronic acid biosynthesis glycosyltransferase TuaC